MNEKNVKYIFSCILMIVLVVFLIYSSFMMIFSNEYIIGVNHNNRQQINQKLGKVGIVESQGEVIIQDIKEHFNIDYNITKVTFQSGIPDGYYLIIYDENNNMKEVLEE